MLLINLCCGWGPTPKGPKGRGHDRGAIYDGPMAHALWWGQCGQWTQGPDRSKALMPCCCSDLIGPDAGWGASDCQLFTWVANFLLSRRSIRTPSFCHMNQQLLPTPRPDAHPLRLQPSWLGPKPGGSKTNFGSQLRWCFEDLWNANFW